MQTLSYHLKNISVLTNSKYNAIIIGMKLYRPREEYTGDEAFDEAQKQGYNPNIHPFVQEIYKAERRAELAKIQDVGKNTLKLVEVDGMLLSKPDADQFIKSKL